MRKRLLWAVVSALALVGVGGCFAEKRTAQREQQLIQEWQEANPDRELTPEIAAEIRAKAEADVKAQIERERQEALKQGASAAGNALSGNWLMAVFDLVGLAGLAFKAKA